MKFKLGFKKWFTENDKENYIDGMDRELSIDPNSIPDLIDSGPVEIDDEGLWFNQAIWQVIKPIDVNDSFVRIKFHKSLSPNLDQRCFVKQSNGKMMPYTGDIDPNRVFLIPMNKFAKMFGQVWQAAIAQQQGTM